MSRLTNHHIRIVVAATVMVAAMTLVARGDLVSRSELGASPSRLSHQMNVPIPSVASLATSTVLPDAYLAAFGGTQTPLYSLDGGFSWHPVHTTPWEGSPGEPLKVAIAPRSDPSAPVRFLVAASSGDQSRVGVYRTGDDGRTWAKTSFPHPPTCTEPDTFQSLIASPADPTRLYLIKICWECITPYGCRAFSGVYSSGDAGLTWQAIKPDAEGAWAHLVPSPVVSGRVYLDGWFQSDDAGQTWTQKDFPVHRLALDAQDPARLYGLYMHTPSGDIGRHSVDGGTTWTDWAEQPCQATDDDKQLIAHPTLANVLLMRCESGLFRSDDGGDHWTRLSSWKGRWIGADQGNAGRILWARDDGLWASDDRDAIWTKLSAEYQSDPIAPWTNASPPDPVGRVNAIAPLSADDVWAVGESGFILHWRGQEWTQVSSPITSSLNSLAFVSPTDGWAVGDRSILHWDGGSWSVITDTADLGLESVDVISPSSAWAVGHAGRALQWDGDMWKAIATPTTLNLHSVDMVSSTDGWAVGGFVDDIPAVYEGVVLRWNGGEWTTVITSTTTAPASVDMVSATEGWIVGIRCPWTSSILHWDGVSWQETAHPAQPSLSSVAMVADNEGWAAGRFYTNDQPSLLHWDGSIWTEAALPSSDTLWAVFALHPDETWVTTYGGSVLRRRPVYHTDLPILLQAYPFGHSIPDLSEDFEPALSPDNERIVFVRRKEGEHSDIFMMNTDGSALRNLTQTSDADEVTPVFSPDGATIAFASDLEGQWDIYFIDPSGADPRARPVITSTESNELHPFFSPGGDVLAFSSNRESGNWDLYTASLTNGAWTRLTTDSSIERFPVWGADGRTLAYRREVNSDSEIHVMDMISRTTRRLTDSPGFDGYPALTRDGSGVVFASNRSGNLQLYSMNIAGTGLLTLTKRPGYRAHTPRLSSDGQTLVYAAAPVSGTYRLCTTTYKSPLEVLASRGAMDARGRCDWTSGVFALGWGTAWRRTGDEAYARRTQDWVDSCTIDTYTIEHVNDGLLGYGALMAYQFDPQPGYLAFAERVADYLLNTAPRTSDGTLAHFDTQVWADTLISAVPFLVEMNRVSGDQLYLDEAAIQIVLHAEVLQDPTTDLFSHAWDEETGEYLSPSYWARGNSWNMIASAQLLNALPVTHALRSQIVSIAQDQAEALAALQDPSGLWHTVVDRSDFYLESSGSAGIMYGLRCGVQAGWLLPDLESATRAAWLTLWRKVSADGTVADVSAPTGPMNDEEAYNAISHRAMQLYGQGMGLLALSPNGRPAASWRRVKTGARRQR